MKTTLVTVFFALLLATGVSAQQIVLEGNYQGKNLYVQNPFAGTGVGFCAYEVTINGDVTTDELQSSAFEIDFTNFQLNIGDPVLVKIRHKGDCHPKVLNPEVLKPRSTYEVVKMNISNDGVLSWTTKSETGKLDFIIEQYRWNKWIKVGEVGGRGTPEEHDYSFKIAPHHGENQFRVKQVDYSGRPRYSKAVKHIDPTIEEIMFAPAKVKKDITFTGETLFEIYDAYGNIVKRGFGDKVNVETLKNGVYYLNYDNKTEKFIKKG